MVDTELIQKHLSGDDQASLALIKKYQNLVYGLAWRMLGNEEDVKDAAQEIFLNMLGALPQFRGDCAFSTWLYRIAMNGCISKSKQRKRQFDAEVLLNDETESLLEDRPSSLRCLEQKERDMQLHQAVDKLAEPYRAVIVLHYFQELAYDEIAQILQIPMGTVKVRLYRAKILLQRKLGVQRIKEDRV